MATFEVQVEGLTSLALDGSSAHTQDELTQFLTDGAKEVINNLPARLLPLCAASQSFTSGTASTLNTGKVLNVFRSDGDIQQPCRQVKASEKGRVTDADEMIHATVTDPAYYIDNNGLDVVPDGGSCTYSEVQYPAVAYGDSAIAVFPDEAEHLVVLYGAIRSLQNLMASKSSNADVTTALTAINTELDETQAICDLVNTQVDAAVTQLGESATQVDASIDTALSAIVTASGRINTAVALANGEFDLAVTSANSSNEDPELAASHVTVGNGFLSEANASANEAQAYANEVSARISQVGGYNQVVSGYLNSAQGYANEIQSKINIAQAYGNEAQARLAADASEYGKYEKQQAKLQADYDKGLQALR